MSKKANLNRLRQLDTLLTKLDSPNEGDEVFFTLVGDKTKYRGIVKKKKPTTGAALYEIVSKTKPSPKGTVETIEYKGRVFKIGGWNKI
jgi:hypothetical protein